jgi:hypothetical protein
MATRDERTGKPVDDGEWVLFCSLVILVLYVAGILAAAMGAVLLVRRRTG